MTESPKEPGHSNPKATCVIIGGGHAAANLAPQLRSKGWQGNIVVISEESLVPYHRPPLSKDYFSQCVNADNTAKQAALNGLYIRKRDFYEKKNIELLLSTRVVRIDRQEKVVQLDNKRLINYDKLAITTGASPRKLDIPGNHLDGVFYMRNITDANKVIEAVSTPGAEPKKAVIIGGGYIGLEAASSLRKIGVSVTILEAAERILQRVTGPVMSDFYRRVHLEEGVAIQESVSGIKQFEGNDKVSAVVCSDSTRYEADIVLVGIGVIPETGLAEASGLEVENGIRVNEFAETNDPNIVAAGDCTNFYSSFYSLNLRLESVPHANSQAATAAASLCDLREPYDFFPWFWSDQYDINLQIAGLSIGYDDIVIRGDLTHGREGSAFYFKGEQIIAMDAINRAKDFMLARKAIPLKPRVDRKQLQDESRDLKTLLGL